MQEGYVYIGEHYDILGRPLGLTDKNRSYERSILDKVTGQRQNHQSFIDI